jgi:2-polyprenyl-3-methyl-5-hydroxy-6-metoxy-1,4-benzoquinol methylase
MSTITCNLCGDAGRFETSRDVARVNSNVRRFRDEQFTVWRCSGCGSLHSLEDIDYARYYDGYFMQRQKMDFFARRLFLSRLRDLKRGGISPTHSILDFGCGNGNFVRFLQDRGYAAVNGYDPYSQDFADRSVCETTYDFVNSQDVIEHAPDCEALLDELAALVRRPGGVLAIGTPNAEGIDLHDRIDAVGQLHQPFHRHILTGKRLVGLVEQRGFRVTRVVPRSYVETWFPFVNSVFLFNYMAAVDGTVDSGFDPIRLRLILGAPKLLLYGLFGRMLNRGKDILVMATAT